MKMVFGIAIFISIVVHTTAQSVVVRGQKITGPSGKIVGTTLDDEKGVFYVEQVVLSTVGQKINNRHLVTSWSLSSYKMLAKREFAIDPGENTPTPRCGDIALGISSHRLFLCGEGGIEILDPSDLGTIGRIAEGKDLKTYRIAVDEHRNSLIVLSGRTNRGWPSSPSGSLWLSLYSLSDGSSQSEIQLGTFGPVDTSELVLDLTHDQIAIALTRRGRDPWNSSVYFCRENALNECAELARVDAISQMSFFENKILFVKQMADRSRDCVMSIDLATHAVAQAYCAPATGVRYALGVVAGKYIVGFTGRNKRAHFLSEEYLNVDNALSLWEAGKPRVAAISSLLRESGILQENVRIMGSDTSSLFLAYAPIADTEDAVLSVYQIAGPN